MMQSFIKAVLVCILITSHLTAAAQREHAVKEMPLSLKIVALCEKITSAENDPLPLMKMLFTDSVTLENIPYYTTDFESNRFYEFNQAVFSSLTLIKLYDPLNKLKYLYEISLETNSAYKFINKKKEIAYDTANKINISYEELSAYLGKSLPEYPPHFQPLESKYYYYIYTHPITHHKAIIIIESFNPIGTNYNVILDIMIASKPLHKIIDFSGLEKAARAYDKKHKIKQR